MPKHAKETSLKGTALTMVLIRAVRAWTEADLAKTPARREDALRRARLLTGQCFSRGLVATEKELTGAEE